VSTTRSADLHCLACHFDTSYDIACLPRLLVPADAAMSADDLDLSTIFLDLFIPLLATVGTSVMTC
jgi:hypothetical protein